MPERLQDLMPSAWLAMLPQEVAAVAVTVAAAAGLVGLRALLLSRLGRLAGRTRNAVDDLLVSTIGRTRTWFLLVVSLALGLALLDLPGPADQALRVVTVVAVALQTGLWLATLLAGALQLWVSGDDAENAAMRTTMVTLRFLIHLVIWSGVVLLALANLGVDVTALVAGLGVGGVAVALAVQNVLGDLFASLSIALDQPFRVGDFIIVDDLMGTVERVGLKTTRVRSLGGEQLVFSNANLLDARIRNYQRMQERRIVFGLGVTYETPPALVRDIPAILESAIREAPDTRFDRAHFKEFGDSALTFEAVYYVLLADYNRYMDIQQQINLEVLDRFAERGIEFAYPTQTLHLVRSRSGPREAAT